MVDHQDAVGCLTDIKLGVLCAAGQRTDIAVVGDWFGVFRVVTMSGDMYHFAGLSG